MEDGGRESLKSLDQIALNDLDNHRTSTKLNMLNFASLNQSWRQKLHEVVVGERCPEQKNHAQNRKRDIGTHESTRI